MNYKTPGVYVEEISKFPPSVAAVETAIPVFIGYTQIARQKEDDDLRMKPQQITSLLEFEHFFGTPLPETGIQVTVNTTTSDILAKINNPSPFVMYYCMQLFFQNGGGPCYIVSVGEAVDGGVIDLGLLSQGLTASSLVDEITIIAFPDSVGLSSSIDYYSLHKSALDECARLQDRFAIMDVRVDTSDPFADNIQTFRDELSGTTDVLKYGAGYFPFLETIYNYHYQAADVAIDLDGSTTNLEDLENSNNALFNQVRAAIDNVPMLLPAVSAIAGIYARVDNTRGVWKAPANISVDGVIRPTVPITDQMQENMNVDVVAGKSINAIRAFTGRGILVWGARTLAGNDNEWRYVSVRRFFNMVEESVKKATAQFVFEPNDANTWTKVKSMIENFLILQWRAGALMGATPEKGFYVKVGLNETMTAIDILEGRMIVEIGMAVVRPAEFIILRFSHKMIEA